MFSLFFLFLTGWEFGLIPYIGNLEFHFLQIVLKHAAPIANDMVAVDPSSTVVRSLRRNQEWKSLIFMLLAKHSEIDYEAVVKLAEVIDFGWC